MRIATRIGSLLFAAGVLFVSGCGGGSETGPGAFQNPNAPRGIAARIATMMLHRPRYHGPSWAKPNPASQQSLLYVTNFSDETVTFYTYQNGNNLALQGTLTGFGEPGQPCVDQTGDVFIPDEGLNTVTEFAHGGTMPLHVFQTGQFSAPLGCSIDKLTGNLAITVNYGVLVYPGASGTPVLYNNSSGMGDNLWCGYDKHGNLYIDGTGTQVEFALAVLPHNAATMLDVSVTGGSIQEPGNVLWIGTNLSVVDTGETTSYFDLLSVSGTHATILSSTHIPNSEAVDGSWKAGSNANAKMIFADAGPQGAAIFTYPAISPYNGGPSGIVDAFGVAVSKGP